MEQGHREYLSVLTPGERLLYLHWRAIKSQSGSVKFD
jgi:hypothetical protein